MFLRRGQRGLLPSVCLLVLALLISACGSDGDSTEAAAKSDATTTVTPAGDKASGSPVKVMVIAPTDNSTYVIDELPVVVKAAAEYLNDHGGAAGHVIETIYCNDKNDPNLAAQCAQQAVDERVVAVVGSASLNMTTSIIPVLERAEIPLINAQAYGPAEMSSPISFQTTGQFIAGYGAVADFLKAKEVKSAVFMHSSSAASAAVNDLVKSGLKRRGIDLADEISMPINAPDVSSFVAKAASADADAIIVSPGAAQTALIIQGLRQAGVDFGQTKVVSYAGTASDLTVKQLGADVMEGVLTVGTYPPPEALEMNTFTEVMDKVDPDHKLTRTETSPGAWAGMLLFAKAAEQVQGDLTAPTLLKALNASGPIDVGMGLPKFTPSANNTALAAFKRFSNVGVFTYVVKNGKFVETEPTFIADPFAS